MPDGVHEQFPGGEWLDPLAGGLTRAMELLDRAKLALVAVAGAVVLLYIGAKIERYQLKSRLAVLDGAAAGVDVDVSEETGGGRS